MRYLTTAKLEITNKELLIDVFLVDDDTYFAYPKDTKEYPEFYFAKVGNFWHKHGAFTYFDPLRSVVEHLGFKFSNRYPVTPNQLKDNEVRPPRNNSSTVTPYL